MKVIGRIHKQNLNQTNPASGLYHKSSASLSRKSDMDIEVGKNSVDSLRESDDVVLEASSFFGRSTEFLQMFSSNCV